MSDDNVQTSTGDLTGKTFGQYEIKQVIGQGGMATVYLAIQTSIGRTVAIKVLPPYFTNDPTFLQRFEREVKVISSLQHPRVLPVYDYGQIDGQPYIVMAHMAGATLAERIKSGIFTPVEALKLVEQIAEGLDHAHKKGIIHRDFKPSNVLLDEHGNAHLADFGIAKISESASQLTGSGVVGTPAYMAPEMADSGEVTPAVDIYALGITLYQMLTGKYPYSGETPIRVMMAHATDPIPDVRQANPDLPESVSGVVRKAMAKDPTVRYASAGDLARDLRAAIEGRPIEAEPFTMGIDRAAMTPTPAMSATPAMPAPVQSGRSPMDAGLQKMAGSYEPIPTRGTLPGQSTEPGANDQAPKKSRTGLWIGGIIGAVVLCGACLFGLFALGGMSMLGGLLATPTPTEPPFAVVRIENQSSETVCYLYVSPSTETTWGDDWLGSDVLAVGDTYVAEELEPGSWDFRADDCDHNTIIEEYGISLDRGDNTWAVVDGGGSSGSTGGGTGTGGDASVTIVNNSDITVCAMYFSPSTDTSWGTDRLSGDLGVGESVTFDNLVTGSWDFRADDCSAGLIRDEFGVILDSGANTWNVGGAQDGATLVIVNESSETICYVYIWPSGTSDRGTDQLGSATIASGQEYSINDIPPGRYNLRAETCAGGVAERLDEEITTETTWTIND